MNFFSSKTLQKTISVLMLVIVCWMVVPQGVSAYQNFFNIASDEATRQQIQQQQLEANRVQSNDFCNIGSIVEGTIQGTFWSKVLTCASYSMLSLSGWFLWASAIIFNFLLDYTLNMPAFVEKFNIVDIGWGAFRDISLVFFVFIILFIAINMIIGKEQYGSKKLLAQVIVAAVLINFSLFFTKVMVDTSNILALQFYSKIVTSSKESLIAGGHQKNLSDVDSGISAAVAHSMGLDQVWGITNTNNATSKHTAEKLGWLNILLVGFFGSVFIMVTAVVFLAGGIMMLIRTLALIFLMILSPFAWLGGILPMTKEISSKWWSTLSSNLVYAPVYMMLMYVVLSMIVANGNNRTVDFLGMFTDTDWNSLAVTGFTFVVLNALMLGCIVVANKAGAVGSGAALSFAKSGLTKAYAAPLRGLTSGTGAALRNTVGRYNHNRADKFAQTAEAGTAEGMKKLKAMRDKANRTYDFRNTELGKKASFLGKGSEKGFKGVQEGGQKEYEDYYNSLGRDAKTAFEQTASAGGLAGISKRTGKILSADLSKKGLDARYTKLKEKLDEFMNNTAVKEFRGLLAKHLQGRASAGEISRIATLAGEISRIDGGTIELINQGGGKETYVALDVARGGIDRSVPDVADIIRKYKTTQGKVYSDIIDKKGF